MKLFRPWVMASVVALAACGDGLKSPDFTPVNTFEGLEVLPAVVGQSDEIPAGTSVRFTAWATFTQTVPPGTRDDDDNLISVRESREDVTGQADWISSASAIASVEAGVVNGLVANPSPVTITASYAPEGSDSASDSVQVTVTDALIRAVDHVKPAGTPRTANDTYTIAAGNPSTFEIYGRFSDNQVRQLTGSNYVVAWSSSDPAVVNNPAGDEVFDGVSIGSANVTGRVTSPEGVNPDSATATVNVRQLSELCLTEFLAPAAEARAGEPSAGCSIQCSVDAPENMIDGDEATAASLNIPLGLLLQSSIPAEVYDLTAQRLVVGQSTGFVVSQPADLLVASLLADIRIDTLNCVAGDPVQCTVVESFAGEGDPSGPLYLSLLGLIGGTDAALVQTGPLTQPANGVRITYDGGLLSALATLDVNAACATAAAPTPAP